VVLLGNLFDRDASVDREAVEVAIELITEEALTEIADQPVMSYRIARFRHHASGIAPWFSGDHPMDDEVEGQPVASVDRQDDAQRFVAPPSMLQPLVPLVAMTPMVPTMSAPNDDASAAAAMDSERSEVESSVPNDDGMVVAALSLLAPWDRPATTGSRND